MFQAIKSGAQGWHCWTGVKHHGRLHRLHKSLAADVALHINHNALGFFGCNRCPRIRRWVFEVKTYDVDFEENCFLQHAHAVQPEFLARNTDLFRHADARYLTCVNPCRAQCHHTADGCPRGETSQVHLSIMPQPTQTRNHNPALTSPAACGSLPIPAGASRWSWDTPS